MKLSEFEMYVLDALIKNDPEEEILRAQLVGVTVLKRDYTGVGLYTDIKVANKGRRPCKTNRYIEEVRKIHLKHPDLEAGAGAMLWFKEGYTQLLSAIHMTGIGRKTRRNLKLSYNNFLYQPGVPLPLHTCW